MAQKFGCTPAFLWQIARKKRPCPHKLAVAIETETAGETTRVDFYPTDYHEIWPELVAVHGLPALPQVA